MINQKEFATVVLNLKWEAFVVYVAIIIFTTLMAIYPACKTQITTFITNRILITVLAKYSNFTDIFFKESAAVLSELIETNIYAINLEKSM